MEKRTIKDLVKIETDWLYSLINDKEWREEMWIGHKCKNKNMLNKQFWTTQKVIIEHLQNCFWSQPSLYTDCVEDMINDKKALREVAKHMSIELKDLLK